VGSLEGKVAFVTGAARGQGRSHAVRLAEEGANIIAVDICETFDSMNYPLATPEDLAQTVKDVEALDRRIVAGQGDVRVKSGLKTVLDTGLAEFGRLDIVVANAGVTAMKSPTPAQAFIDGVDVDLQGGGSGGVTARAAPRSAAARSARIPAACRGFMQSMPVPPSSVTDAAIRITRRTRRIFYGTHRGCAPPGCRGLGSRHEHRPRSVRPAAAAEDRLVGFALGADLELLARRKGSLPR
jgi:NAD(P)-dependent dehydrogenase (short-subunit alcohol dehydrogenase family)